MEKFSDISMSPKNETLPKAEGIIFNAETPGAMREHTFEQEKMNNTQFELAREFQQEEQKAFASIETNDNKDDSWRSRMKKGIMAVTAGVILMTAMTAMPAFAKESQLQETEQQIQKLQEQKLKLKQQERIKEQESRRQELQGYLDNFHINGLVLGEPSDIVRRPCEQYGIYIGKNHIDDIYSKNLSFSPGEFINNVTEILRNNGILIKSAEKKEQAFYIDISTKAQEILNKWKWHICDGKIDISGKKELNLNSDSKTKSVSIAAVGEDKIVIIAIDKDGTITKMEGVRGELLFNKLK